MNNYAVLGALALGSAMIAAPAQALDLTGQSVNGSYTLQYGDTNIVPFASPQVVGAGTEFTGTFTDTFNSNLTVAVDVYASGFTVSFTGDGNGNVAAPDYLRVDLSGLSGLGPISLASYTCTPTGQFPCTTFNGGPSVDSSGSTSTSAFVSFGVLRSGEVYNFSLGDAVPEPASWAMMIAGFGLAGAAMRRRPSQALAAA